MEKLGRTSVMVRCTIRPVSACCASCAHLRRDRRRPPTPWPGRHLGAALEAGHRDSTPGGRNGSPSAGLARLGQSAFVMACFGDCGRRGGRGRASRTAAKSVSKMTNRRAGELGDSVRAKLDGSRRSPGRRARSRREHRARAGAVEERAPWRRRGSAPRGGSRTRGAGKEGGEPGGGAVVARSRHQQPEPGASGEAGIDRVAAVRLEPGDVGEDEAASRLAAAVAGEHVAVERPSPGDPTSTPRATGSSSSGRPRSIVSTPWMRRSPRRRCLPTNRSSRAK